MWVTLSINFVECIHSGCKKTQIHDLMEWWITTNMWYWIVLKLFLYLDSLAKIHECISTRSKLVHVNKSVMTLLLQCTGKDLIAWNICPIQHSPFKSTILNFPKQHFSQRALISARVTSTKMLNLEENGVEFQK